MSLLLGWLNPEIVTTGEASPGRRKRLTDAIFFTRRWTPTYMVVGAAILLIFIIQNLWGKYRYSRRHATFQHTSEVDTKHHAAWRVPYDCGPRESSSENSSRAQDHREEISPVKEDEAMKHNAPSRTGDKNALIDEETPLLSHTHHRHIGRFQVWNFIKAFLIYQPAPIPGITNSQNVLPSNGETIVILLLFAPNLFYLFYRAPISLDSLIIISDRAGLLIAVNLPFLYLFGAKNQPLRWLMGRSYESLNILHRRLAEWMVFLAVIHSIGLTLVFWPIFVTRGHNLWYFLTYPLIKFGYLSFLSYLVLYGTSVGYVRELFYEAFLVIHVLGQIAGLSFLYLHFHRCQTYTLISAGIWAVDRILMRITITPVTVKATAKIAQDGETVLLSAKIPVRLTQIPLLGLRVNIRDGWEPAQHVFITVPSLSRTAKFQAHPYTILSMPDIQCPTDGGPVYRSLELIIRARDGFTRDLLNMIKEHQKDSLDSAILANLPVRIDGPYGSTEVLEAVKTADRALFIAGGSGLAVTSPLADATSRNHCSLSQTLNQLTITIPKDRLSHYWILRSTTHTSWLPSNLSNPTLLPPTGTDSLQGPARKEAHSSLLDEALSWMEKYGDIDDGKRIVVVVSGPDGMIRGVRKKCAALVKRGWKLEIWVEKFGW